MSKPILRSLLAIALAMTISHRTKAAEAAKPQLFDTPRAAAEAFLKALEREDRDAIRSMLTPAFRARIERNPEQFESALATWLDKRGRGLTIDDVGKPEQRDAPGTWRASAFLHFKGEGNAVMNTLLTTVSADQKCWQIEL